jgi:predicted RNase H-like HicB family nuclease
MMPQMMKIAKLMVKKIAFPIFIYKDEEGFFVARNLLVDIATQAKSAEHAKARIKEATLDYLMNFPEDIEHLKSIDIESSSFTNIELDSNDIQITDSTIRV